MSGKETRDTFADIVRSVTSTPSVVEQPRPGVYGDGFVDQDHCVYSQVAGDIDSCAAQELAATGARVVWDPCGCGGGCNGLQRYTQDEVALMVLSGPPTIHRTKRKYGRIAHLRASDGSSLLLVEVAVSWGPVLG